MNMNDMNTVGQLQIKWRMADNFKSDNFTHFSVF